MVRDARAVGERRGWEEYSKLEELEHYRQDLALPSVIASVCRHDKEVIRHLINHCRKEVTGARTQFKGWTHRPTSVETKVNEGLRAHYIANSPPIAHPR